MSKESLDILAVENFRNYLKIPSVHPDVNYDESVNFLKKQAESLQLPFKVHYVKPNKPIVIITWQGKQPSIPSILLNSHMDVVPVNKENWTYDPFLAYIDETGKIFARGAQDMKSVGIQYLEAIRRLRASGVQIARTIHCSFVPDEEIGGIYGMKAFIQTEEFKALNVGFAMDEGIPSQDDQFYLYYAEKCMWHMKFRCPGPVGHGSTIMENTAAHKVRILMDKIDNLRNSQIDLLKRDPSKDLGDVMTININMIQGGVQTNVLPSEICLWVDNRIPITTNLEEWERQINNWCNDAGDGITWEKLFSSEIVPPTKLDESNCFWMVLKSVMGDRLKLKVFPAATDSRHLREIGIPALGLSLINNTPNLLHDDNEYLDRDVFLNGIEIYCKIIPAIGNAA